MGTLVRSCPICGDEVDRDTPMADAKVGRRADRRRRPWWTREPVCLPCAREGMRLESDDGKTVAHPDPLPRLSPVVVCEVCGQKVHMESDKRRKHVTCSNSCRQKLYKTKRVAATVTCDGCGNTYEPARSDSRFCSAACRQKAYRERHR